MLSNTLDVKKKDILSVPGFEPMQLRENNVTCLLYCYQRPLGVRIWIAATEIASFQLPFTKLSWLPELQDLSIWPILAAYLSNLAATLKNFTTVIILTIMFNCTQCDLVFNCVNFQRNILCKKCAIFFMATTHRASTSQTVTDEITHYGRIC